MDSPSLDPDLAREFTSEPVTDSHLADLYELVSAESTAVLGMCPHTVEDVRSWITPPEGGRSAQLLVRDRDHGAPAQWGRSATRAGRSSTPSCSPTLG